MYEPASEVFYCQCHQAKVRGWRLKSFFQEYTSGLEGSAVGGEGFGIEKFKPQRGPLQISKNLKIPNIAKVLLREGENSDGYVVYEEADPGSPQWQAWPTDVIEKANMEGANYLSSDFNSSIPLKSSSGLM